MNKNNPSICKERWSLSEHFHIKEKLEKTATHKHLSFLQHPYNTGHRLQIYTFGKCFVIIQLCHDSKTASVKTSDLQQLLHQPGHKQNMNAINLSLVTLRVCSLNLANFKLYKWCISSFTLHLHLPIEVLCCCNLKLTTNVITTQIHEYIQNSRYLSISFCPTHKYLPFLLFLVSIPKYN